jgi:hypothetical protein
MTLDVDISNWTNCQVPLKLPVVVSCETISVTYTLVGEDPVTVEVGVSYIFNDRNAYEFTVNGDDSTLRWNGTRWDYYFSGIIYLSEDTPCPFGVYTIEEDSIFEAFEVNPIL